MITIPEVLESFRDAISTELDSQGLADWSINASGGNFKELFSQLDSTDLQNILNEITEGLPMRLTIDIAEPLALEIEEILRMRILTNSEETDED